MGSFLKYTFASTIGTIVGILTSFFVIVVLVVGATMLFTSDEEEEKVKSGSVLKLIINGQLQERELESPFNMLNGPLGLERDGMGLLELRKVIEKAKRDKNIKGIYLELGSIEAGMASISELRSALLDFKNEGKFVVAYSENYLEKEYFLASVADDVYMNPAGYIEFNGFYSEVMFFARLFEKVGIKPLAFKAGDFKSAIEPFIKDSMSVENRLQLTAFLNSVYINLLHDIAASREISFEELKMLSDSMDVRTPDKAQATGLITAPAYYNEVEDAIMQKLEGTEKINFVSYKKYKKGLKISETEGDNQVAVIFASGNIMSGDGGEYSGVIGSANLVKTLRKVREDKKIKAVVLRINSPGGSALASDVIWKEIQLTNEKKPVIASMSDMAASGGYYMAMGCNKIVAQKYTLTGSIGVFYLMFNVKDFLNDKLGITTEGVKVGEYADLGNPTREMTDKEAEIIQQEVDRIYQTFLNKASKGRDMDLSSIEILAGGRIWVGSQAIKNGLVDIEGGLEKAITLAAIDAGLENGYSVNYIKKDEFGFDKWLKNMNESSIKKYSEDLYPYLYQFDLAKRIEGAQARIPFDFQYK